ncbi:hypothetical protein K402DRAFT_326681 [Aulographum hederae CBS 113979]|uniref:AA1-like domain-containing protein n=1 Tax=Aulographum hederae CBS 113979 TaxID=1176131 RepID=A0A6G1H855_9PEZI|nr:hypothetical protein K402DRAFT_326681 [Aulographum hederae CBS 113979]
MLLQSFSGLAAAAAWFASTALAQSTCQSYGIDYQNRGVYFINSASNDTLTIVSEFEGAFDSRCQNDTASVILVDPNGDDTYCSNISINPGDGPQTTTCPVFKSNLSSGNYSLLILSNNGNDPNPFTSQRMFYLDVGQQVTTTVCRKTRQGMMCEHH